MTDQEKREYYIALEFLDFYMNLSDSTVNANDPLLWDCFLETEKYKIIPEIITKEDEDDFKQFLKMARPFRKWVKHFHEQILYRHLLEAGKN